MATVTLAHVSDLHLPFTPALSLGQHFSKRQLSVWSWRRRHANQSPVVLARLVAELRQAAVDHIVVTGDLVNFALPAEFSAAAAWLQRLAPAERISIVPGNHDALVPVPDSEGMAKWAPWTRLGPVGWPFVHRVGEVALIGVSTAVPTLPLLARGRVGAAQLARLETVLRETTGACRVVLLHHPIVDHVVHARKALADRAAVREVLRRTGAELVLYGHARNAHFDAVPGPRGDIPCICVPSSSALPNPQDEGARWNRLTMTGVEGGWRLQVQPREWSVDAGAFIDGKAVARTLVANVPA